MWSKLETTLTKWGYHLICVAILLITISGGLAMMWGIVRLQEGIAHFDIPMFLSGILLIITGLMFGGGGKHTLDTLPEKFESLKN